MSNIINIIIQYISTMIPISSSEAKALTWAKKLIRRGRPKEYGDMTLVTVRIPKILKLIIYKIADDNRVSRAELIRLCLIQGLLETGLRQYRNKKYDEIFEKYRNSKNQTKKIMKAVEKHTEEYNRYVQELFKKLKGR